MMNIKDIGSGAIEALFQEELEKVIRNVHDLRTKADTLREINIKLKIKPDKTNRNLASLETIVTSKLAPVPHTTQILSGVNDNGRVEVKEAELAVHETQLSLLEEAGK